MLMRTPWHFTRHTLYRIRMLPDTHGLGQDLKLVILDKSAQLMLMLNW